MTQILWSFSIWLESVAILPQLFMLQRTGEAETITTHYIFALGAYRTLYLFNWVYRYYFEENYTVDWIASIAGLLQTALYSDFFYIYYVKWVVVFTIEGYKLIYYLEIGLLRDRSLSCQSKLQFRVEMGI